MMGRFSLAETPWTFKDAWEHYQLNRDCLTHAYQHASICLAGSGAAPSSLRFLSADELPTVEDEIDTQACLSLLATTEAMLRRDYCQRVLTRRKDSLSRHFRRLAKESPHGPERIRLEDLLDAWKTHHPDTRKSIGQLLGAFKYRHWLAHGRWWLPDKNFQRYDPTGLRAIVSELCRVTGLN